jgi:hypothetical protein
LEDTGKIGFDLGSKGHLNNYGKDNNVQRNSAHSVMSVRSIISGCSSRGSAGRLDNQNKGYRGRYQKGLKIVDLKDKGVAGYTEMRNVRKEYNKEKEFDNFDF